MDAVLAREVQGRPGCPACEALAELLPRKVQQSRGSCTAAWAGRGSSPRARPRWARSPSTRGSPRSAARRSSTSSSSRTRSPSTSSRSSRDDIRDLVERRHASASTRSSGATCRRRSARPCTHRVQRQLPDIVHDGHRRDRRQHRPAAGRQADGHPPPRGAARAGQPDLPEVGAPGAALHHQLRLLLRLRAAASRPSAIVHCLPYCRGCCRVLGMLVGWVTNWLAIRMIFEPIEPRKHPGFEVAGPVPQAPEGGRRRLRRGDRRRHRHAENIGDELLNGAALGPHPRR